MEKDSTIYAGVGKMDPKNVKIFFAVDESFGKK
jgi:hypothetical protein